jgi:hypothetical protein
LEQRACDLLLVCVLFTNKLLEQRAYDLLLVGVHFTNKILEQRAYDLPYWRGSSLTRDIDFN